MSIIEKTEIKPERVKLTETEQLRLVLEAERVQTEGEKIEAANKAAVSAQNLQNARQADLQRTFANLTEKYGEGGKYKVTNVDMATMEVVRELAPFRAAETAAAPAANGAADLVPPTAVPPVEAEPSSSTPS